MTSEDTKQPWRLDHCICCTLIYRAIALLFIYQLTMLTIHSSNSSFVPLKFARPRRRPLNSARQDTLKGTRPLTRAHPPPIDFVNSRNGSTFIQTRLRIDH